MSSSPPSVTVEAATRVANSVFGMTVESATPLPGFVTQNFLIANGEDRFVLKLADESESVESLQLQNDVLDFLGDQELPFATPNVLRSLHGQSLIHHDLDGQTRYLRMLSFLPGKLWSQGERATLPQLFELGTRVGQLDAALLRFHTRHDTSHDTSHEWDLTRAAASRDDIPKIPDAAHQEWIETCLQQFQAHVVPRLSELRRSIIHGDLNEANILVSGPAAPPRITGILDFGDAMANPLICDLAIAIAYGLLDQEDPLSAITHIVAGFHKVLPIEPAELDVLYPLICSRLAVSVSMAARNRLLTPDNAHQFFTEKPAWNVLEKLTQIPYARATAALHQVCDAPTSWSRVPDKSRLAAERQKRIGPSLSLAYEDPLLMAYGRGQYLVDARGDAYLDLVNNVCHVGHCHPDVVAAGQRQMARLNTNTRYLYPQLTEYADRICATLPAALEVCYFVCSGSEANDLAIRMARTHTGRRDVIVHDAAYHGHTSTLIDISPYKFMGKGGAGKPADWVHVIPTPDTYRGPHRGITAAEDYARHVHTALATENPVAAFISESILGCGGQIVPPAGYLREAAQAIRRHGGLCILDEVQVGFGRIGSHFWGFESQDVVPDIVVLGKPIGNGHPMGAVVTTREIADSFHNGMEFFSTFGGNPVSCSIGMAVLDVIEQEQLQQNAAVVGQRFMEGLRSLAQRHPIIGDVRGAGLFIGVELVKDPATREPAADAAKAMTEALRRRGILLSVDGPEHNVLKIKPPLVIDEGDVDRVLRTLDRVLVTR